ncbi:MAG: hypothetical protein ACOC2L_04290, partial [Candidatus Sumerlaeota bacterium]
LGPCLTACSGTQALRPSASGAEKASHIWWEAEAAFAENMQPGVVEAVLPADNALSGGAWLRETASSGSAARWLLDVPQKGEWYFYIRKTRPVVANQYRFVPESESHTVRGGWKNLYYLPVIDQSVSDEIGEELVWNLVGKETLEPGPTFFEMQIQPGQNVSAGIDCFLLSRQPFWPDGKQKPEARKYHTVQGYSAFMPRMDPFNKTVMDLRNMNHAFAGEKGFLERHGEHFIFQNDDDTPARFFGVSLGRYALLMNNEQLDRMARMLAKYGVNIVRIPLDLQGAQGEDPGEINPLVLDRLHYAVHAFRREGVYTALTLFAPEALSVENSWKIPGYPVDGKERMAPWALIFYHPRMQLIYEHRARSLLRSPNPYHRKRISLSDDPALALVEVLDGDSLFAPTFQPGETIPREALAPLERKFAAFAREQYGSLEAARDAWAYELSGDDIASERLALMPSQWLTSSALALHPERKSRASDQIRFFTKLMRDFYSDTRYWLKYSLGVQCPVLARGGPTVDASLLGPLDHYSAMGADAVAYKQAVAGYQRPVRRGRLSEGDLFRPREHLEAPTALRALQYADYPVVFSDLSWPMRNRYRAEGPLFAAAYGALQGVDAIFFAEMDSFHWRSILSQNSVATPAQLGQFPAAAKLYRRGDIATAPIVVKQSLNLEELYRLQGSGVEEPVSPDPLFYENLPAFSSGVSVFDPLAYYVGRVQRVIDNEDMVAKDPDLSDFIDRREEVVISSNGSLKVDYGKALLTFDTERTQGAAGRLNAVSTIGLANLLIESKNDYGVIAATALDDKPLSESEAILLQVMTTEQNFDYEEADAPSAPGFRRVEKAGVSPINIRHIRGKIALKHQDIQNLGAVALDSNGYPMLGIDGRRVRYSKINGMLVVELDADVMYYLIVPAGKMRFLR